MVREFNLIYKGGDSVDTTKSMQERILAVYQRLFRIDPNAGTIGASQALDTILNELEGLHWIKDPKALDLVEGLQKALAAMRERKDEAYLERNQLVAALSKIYPSGIAKTAIPGWSEDWHGCVYIDSPVGQLSWHYHDSQAYLFEHLPEYTKPWDGHTTEEKYERLAKLGTSW